MIAAERRLRNVTLSEVGDALRSLASAARARLRSLPRRRSTMSSTSIGAVAAIDPWPRRGKPAGGRRSRTSRRAAPARRPRCGNRPAPRESRQASPRQCERRQARNRSRRPRHAVAGQREMRADAAGRARQQKAMRRHREKSRCRLPAWRPRSARSRRDARHAPKARRRRPSPAVHDRDHRLRIARDQHIRDDIRSPRIARGSGSPDFAAS